MSHIFCTARDSAFEQLCSLFEELDTLYRHMRPDLFCKPEGTARDRALVAGLIAGPDSTILVAASAAGDEVFCLATLIIRRQPMLGVRRARDYVEIDNLVVRQTARRRAIGRGLVQHALAWASARGFGGVELAVHTFNTDAVRFYDALGFATTLRRMALMPIT